MKVFSFCLYGVRPKYVRGMHENIKTIHEKFPDFKVLIYYGSDTPISEFLHYENVIIIKGVYSDNQLMLDRFCAIDDPSVEIMFVRDADSRIHERDEWCIREFIQSPKVFHIIRDHPFHTTPIMGGLWGIKKYCISHLNMRRYIEVYRHSYKNATGYDQHFLRDILYSKIESKALIHGCVKLTNTETIIPIPFKHAHMFCGQAIEYTNEGAEYHNCNDCKYLI